MLRMVMHGLFGTYWFEEVDKTVTINAARYRDVIKNFSYDLSETFSEGNGLVRARWDSTSYCPYMTLLLI